MHETWDMMGSKDSNFWLYMMCITKSQEKSIKLYFKKKKWETDWLVRIPENHLSIGVELFRKVVGSTKVCEKLERQLRSQPVLPQTEHMHVPSSSQQEIMVNNDSFRQVGIFDEVFKLAETSKQTPATEQGRSRSSKKRVTRKSRDRACKNAVGVQEKSPEMYEEDCLMPSSDDETEREQRLVSNPETRVTETIKNSCKDMFRYASKTTVDKLDNKTRSGNITNTAELLVNAENGANMNQMVLISMQTDHDTMVAEEEELINEKQCKDETQTADNDNNITTVESNHTKHSSPFNQLTRDIHPQREMEDKEGDSTSRQGKRKHKLESLKENQEIMSCEVYDTSPKPTSPDGPLVYAKNRKLRSHKLENLKERQEMLGCEVKPHTPTIPDAPLGRTSNRKNGNHKLDNVKEHPKPSTIVTATIPDAPLPRTRKRKTSNKLMSLQERQEVLRCGVCGRGMASEQFYKRHMRLMHSEEAMKRRADLKQRRRDTKVMQACTLCKKQFVDKNGLQTHMTRIHGDAQTSFQCDLCGAVLKFKGNLMQHMKSVHTDARPYPCHICHKQFKVLHQLKNHQRRHDPDYIETCITCGKTIKKGQLTAHMRRHADIRPYKCDSCEKSFFEKQDLERHLRIHSGEKPFKCPHCNYASTMRGNLTKHLKHVKHKLDTDAYTNTQAEIRVKHKLDADTSSVENQNIVSRYIEYSEIRCSGSQSTTYAQAENRVKHKLDHDTYIQSDDRGRHKLETEMYTQTEAQGVSGMGMQLGRCRSLDDGLNEGPASTKLYSYPREPGTKSSERFHDATTVYVVPRDGQSERAYFIDRNHHQQQQLQQSPYPDHSDQFASPESHGAKIKHLENSSVSEVEISTSTVNEMGQRYHVGGVELYPSHMQAEGPLILTDNVRIPVSHVEVTKVMPAGEQNEIDGVGGGGPGYSEETTLYTLKPAGDVSYIEEQRQYGEAAGEQRPSLPGLPQFKENYQKFTLPQGQDARYSYTQY